MPRQLHTSQARAGVLLRVAAAAALLDGERKLQKAIMLLLNMRERTNAVCGTALFTVAIWRPLMCIINYVLVCDKLGDLMPYQPEGG